MTTMSIKNMFGDLDKIDILAETKTGEVVMVLYSWDGRQETNLVGPYSVRELYLEHFGKL